VKRKEFQMNRVRPLVRHARRAGLLLLVMAVLVGTLLPQAALASASAAPAASSGPPGNSRTYTVQRGDTLSGIAQRFGTSVQAIMEANGLRNPHQIFVGQVLIIPTGGDMGGPTCTTFHQVRPGDTMTNIARRYGVDVFDLARANNIFDLNRIYVGQSLCIPGSQGMPMPPVPLPQPLPQPQPQPQPLPQPMPQPQPLPQPLPPSSEGPHQPPPGWQPQPPMQPQPPGPDFTPPGPQPPPPSMPSDQGQFWLGSYFTNKDLSGDPLYKRHDPQLLFEWGQGGPGGGIPNDNFSVLWTRSAFFKAGRYRFFATTDDGMRVFVNDQKLIDVWRVQAPSTFFGDIDLREGHHLVRVEYFEEAGNATAIVYWQPLQ
jgi:LysM repeat protein